MRTPETAIRDEFLSEFSTLTAQAQNFILRNDTVLMEAILKFFRWGGYRVIGMDYPGGYTPAAVLVRREGDQRGVDLAAYLREYGLFHPAVTRRVKRVDGTEQRVCDILARAIERACGNDLATFSHWGLFAACQSMRQNIAT